MNKESSLIYAKLLSKPQVKGLDWKNGGIASALASDASRNVAMTFAKAGVTKRGSDGANALKSTANRDIFCGGKGNDTVTGVNGRGGDVIVANKGTLTLLFKDLRTDDIVQKLDSRTKVMTITRKSDSNQAITVKGYPQHRLRHQHDGVRQVHCGGRGHHVHRQSGQERGMEEG